MMSMSQGGPQPIRDVPRGHFYGPCSGQDIPIAFQLFGDTVDRFTFCDLGYRGPRVTARESLPDEWTLVLRIQGIDEVAAEKATWYSSNRPLRPRATVEIWRRSDGSEVFVEMRCDLAQDVLVSHFTPASMAAFIHINDATGEGGSDLWFLATPDKTGGPADRGNRLLPEVVSRLANGAVVVTDATLADAEFRSDASFELAERRWELIEKIPNLRRVDRLLRVWRVHRPDETG